MQKYAKILRPWHATSLVALAGVFRRGRSVAALAPAGQAGPPRVGCRVRGSTPLGVLPSLDGAFLETGFPSLPFFCR